MPKLPPLLWLLAFVQFSTAQSGSWVTPRSATWSSAANWSGGTVASGTDSVADFSGANPPAPVVVTLDGARTAGSLVFGNQEAVADWTLLPGTGGGLTLGVTNGAPVININHRSATLNLVISGNKGLSKQGAGTLVLAGANTYSGATNVLEGTLRLQARPVIPAGVRIMPLGDSITYGYDGSNAGYRGPLHNLLKPLVTDFRYVGTSLQRPGQLPVTPIDQRANEGHSSYTLLDVSNNLDGFDNTRFLQHGGVERNPNGGYWLTGGNGTGRGPMNPGLILMLLGTNDLPESGEIASRVHTLLEKITTLCPTAGLMVAKIPPNTHYQSQVMACNAILESAVNSFRSTGKRVSLVDLNTGFPVNGFSPDGVHPNDTGFEWMARQWYEAIVREHTPEGGAAEAIPWTSQVVVAAGAKLDLAGHATAFAGLTNSGILDLGNGGVLNSFTAKNLATGTIQGSGTIGSLFTHSGTGIGSPGDNITFTGTVNNEGTISTANGASLHFTGTLNNKGTLVIGTEATFLFEGQVNNTGTIRVIRKASLQGHGTLVNNGVLDLITSGNYMGVNLINNGIVLDSSLVRTKTAMIGENEAVLTIDGHTGHNYQLQQSVHPAEGWENVGDPQPGVTGGELTFSTAIDPESPARFYRIGISP